MRFYCYHPLYQAASILERVSKQRQGYRKWRSYSRQGVLLLSSLLAALSQWGHRSLLRAISRWRRHAQMSSVAAMTGGVQGVMRGSFRHWHRFAIERTHSHSEARRLCMMLCRLYRQWRRSTQRALLALKRFRFAEVRVQNTPLWWGEELNRSCFTQVWFLDRFLRRQIVLWRIEICHEAVVQSRMLEWETHLTAKALHAWRCTNAITTRACYANRKAMLRVGWVMLSSSMAQWRQLASANRRRKGRRHSIYGRIELRRMRPVWVRWRRVMVRRNRARAISPLMMQRQGDSQAKEMEHSRALVQIERKIHLADLSSDPAMLAGLVADKLAIQLRMADMAGPEPSQSQSEAWTESSRGSKESSERD